MKKLWIVGTVAMLLATGFAFPAMADENVAGTWNGTIRVRQGGRGALAEDEFTLVLKQDGQAVTGTWSQKLGGTGARGGKAVDDISAKGTLEGDKLSLKIGQQRWLDATVSGNSMSGKTAFGNNPAGDLNGTRAK